jgi:hypothetical protein
MRILCLGTKDLHVAKLHTKSTISTKLPLPDEFIVHKSFYQLLWIYSSKHYYHLLRVRALRALQKKTLLKAFIDTALAYEIIFINKEQIRKNSAYDFHIILDF